MMRLVLIRHGKTRANEEQMYCGSTDLSLTESGKDELKVLSENGGYPVGPGFIYYTSGMVRTEETLEALFGSVDHKPLTGLREMDFGDFEMHSYEQLKDDPVYRAWCSGDNESNIAPGGESGQIMRRRVLETIDKLIGEGHDAIVVCHGGPIAAIMDALFPEEEKNRFEWQPSNGKGYLIQINGNERNWSPVPDQGGI